MSEFIGSRISLISKSDIKYIGTLHEINSESHTVALESVTSYGTEGRKGNPAEEIPGSDQVYEYIVFRGSDVKELTIVSPPNAPKENQPPQVPNDPAILGSARPGPPGQQQQQPPPPPHQQDQFRGPQPSFQNQQPYGYPPPGPPPGQFPAQPPRFQGPGGPHGFPGAPGAVPAYGSMGYHPPPGYGMPPYGPPPGQGMPNQSPGPFPPGQMPGPPGHLSNQQAGQKRPAGHKEGTPQPAAANQATQPTSQKPAEKSSVQTQGPPPHVDSKPSTAAATAPTGPAKAPVPKAVQKASNNRVAVPLPSPNALAAKPSQRPASNNHVQATQPQTTQPQSIADATQAATAAVAAAMAKLGPAKPQAGSVEGITQQVNQMRVQGGQQRGRGHPRGGPRGGRRDSGTKAMEVPKEDYDFESANAKFNKQDLVKEAIASGSPAGEMADPITSTNGHPEAEDVVIPSKPTTGEKGYDKKSSFFDNISSDLKDRVQQQANDQQIDGRAIRREERTKNIDTFGQGSVDGGYRGGFRGRGRGRGGFNRGGRGGNGYRGRGRGGAEATVG
ncbi:Hypothetical protein R9X50_00714500 [Acrodontium crateriforme]|uniref:Uncharacterized protein n=1 Tax=Acrodontium crateriforme TaxID=150365 RepID=A0AAQ3MCM3_9PEZI|nr:Hypothetical protein R9X50_00714500 [Acrodontium crateriforme]